jgi:hypothetical protein
VIPSEIGHEESEIGVNPRIRRKSQTSELQSIHVVVEMKGWGMLSSSSQSNHEHNEVLTSENRRCGGEKFSIFTNRRIRGFSKLPSGKFEFAAEHVLLFLEGERGTRLVPSVFSLGFLEQIAVSPPENAVDLAVWCDFFTLFQLGGVHSLGAREKAV